MKKTFLTLLCLLTLGASTAWAQDEEAKEAIIGTTKYATLEEAITAASSNQTISLLKDITRNAYSSLMSSYPTSDGDYLVVIPADKNITLDLNGHSIKAEGTTRDQLNKNVLLNAGKLKLTDTSETPGTIEGRVGVEGYPNSNTTIEKININGYYGCVKVYTPKSGGINATITINSGTFTSDEYAVLTGNGAKDANGSKIYVNGGTFNATSTVSGRAAVGIYAPNDDTWIIAGGTFNIEGGSEAAVGVLQRAGWVSIPETSTAVFNVNSSDASKQSEFGASTQKFTTASLIFDSKSGYPDVEESWGLTVKGGTFDSNGAPATWIKDDAETKNRIEIAGGHFNKAFGDEYAALGYKCGADGKGGFTAIDNVTRIYTLADLELFRDNVYSGEKNYDGEIVLLMNDIDATAASWAYGIGQLNETDGDAKNPFQGTFDGQGYTIKGLTVNTKSVQNAALFAAIQGATIKNLNLYECTMKGMGHRVAGIVARAFGTDNKILNCSVKNSDIECTNNPNADHSLVAGIAATVTNAEISGCLVSGTCIVGRTHGGTCNGAGGIVANLYGTCIIKNNTVVAGDSTSVHIWGKTRGVGAIIGENHSGDVHELTTGGHTISGNSYDANVIVAYWSGSDWTYLMGPLTQRGFDRPSVTSDPAGISMATQDISTAIVELKVKGNTQTWKTYNGSAQTPDAVEVKFGSTTLTENTHYTLTYQEMIEPGVYPQAIKITGMGSFYGSVYADFTICKPLTHKDIVITPEELPSRFYTGTAQTVGIKVTDNGVDLTEGIDYELIYTNNTGTATTVTEATVEIKGIGIYIGSVSKKFYIMPTEMTETKDGNTIKFVLNDKTNTVSVKQITPTTKDIVVHATIKPDATNFPSLELTVTGIKAGAFNNTTINSVTLPETITDIEDDAFLGATNLHWIDASEATGYTPASLSRTSGAFNGINKRSLIFLNGMIPSGENYVYKVGADNYQSDELIIYDDINGNQQGFDDAAAAKWGFQNPIEFTANTVTNPRKLTATASDKQQGYTTCLPYELTITDAMKVYALAYSKGAFTMGSDNYDGLIGVEEVKGTIEAMKPYILVPAESGALLATKDAKIVKTYNGATSKYVPTTDATSLAATGEAQFTMCGTMEYLPGATTMYIMQKDNVWNAATATDYPGPCVLPMRAYIIAYVAPARLFTVFYNADGTTTAIDNFVVDNDDKAEVFDLQGRKVKNPAKGLYIVNGKKAIVK